MAKKDHLTEELNRHFGFGTFKGNQKAIIENVLAGKDTFVLMPTGGGKSLCYQLPSILMEGTAIVISPLIALMKNQVDAMRNFSEEDGVAHFINSSLNKSAIDQVKSDILSGRTKLLYVAPESLTKEENVDFLRQVKISFYAVDEAHCISEWGHDFRPEYRRIRPIINEIGKRPLIALTATATPKVQHDIQKNLGMIDATVFKSSFNRSNLYYEVRPKGTNIDREIIKYIKANEGKSGIVYCLSRKKVEEFADILKANGIKALPYHAGMDSQVRSANQDAFLMEQADVIVATIAFGMGIDKPDVRIVLHLDLPDSPEAYFQEAGRAGRDGEKAYAVILYSKSDKTTLHKRVVDTFPDKEYILNVYEHLQYYYQMAMGDGFQCIREFNLEEFCRKFKYFPVPVDSALKILTQAGYLEYTDEQDNSSRILFTIRRDELYKLREMGKEAEALIQSILRSYTGVFTDYAYISEESLAVRTGLTRQQIYNILVTLTKRRIVDYIPRKKTPYIIYTRERLELRFLHIPPSVYEERKARYEARIKAMEEYVTTENICRSRMLLRYFGEKNEHNCGQCDVCLSKRATDNLSEESYEEVKRQILDLLSHSPLTPAETADQIKAEKEDIGQVIRYLLDEGELKMQDGMLHISK